MLTLEHPIQYFCQSCKKSFSANDIVVKKGGAPRYTFRCPKCSSELVEKKDADKTDRRAAHPIIIK